MMRKIVACLLVLMMILSLTSTAFAAISDVTVDQYEKTVTQEDPAVFLVTVTNDNKGMARDTTFSVTGNDTLVNISSFDPATVDLGRNDSVQVELRIETGSLSKGNHTFQVEAKAPYIQGRGNNGQSASSMTSGVITLVVGAAGSIDPDPVDVTGVMITEGDQTITEGGTVQLSATVSPANATNQTVTWSSGTPSIATVDSTGLVTGVAPGTAEITVTTEDGSFTDTVNITVEESIVLIPVTGVAIDQEDQTITEGGTVQLSATVNPTDATNKAVTWSSGNTAAATVDSNSGLVTGVAPGTAVITVTTEEGSFTDTVNITVEEPLAPTSLSYVALGDSLVTGTTGISGTMTSYVHGFRSFLETQYGVDVLLTNLAADGDASDDLLAKLYQTDFAATVADADVITLAIGGNNVMPAARESGFWSIDHAMAEAGTTAFENEYVQIVERIRTLNEDADLIVMTLYNPYNSDNQPTGYSGDTVLHDEAAVYVDRINSKIEHYATIGKYSVADVHAEFLKYAARGKMGDITYFYPAYSRLTWWFVKNTRDPHPKQAGQNLMQSIHENVFKATLLEISASQTEYPEAA